MKMKQTARQHIRVLIELFLETKLGDIYVILYFRIFTLVVPRGTEHRPVAEAEVSVLLFEPASTLNTGDADSDLSRPELEQI